MTCRAHQRSRPPTSASAYLFMIDVKQWQHDLEREGQGEPATSVFDRWPGQSVVRFFEIAATSPVGMFNAIWPMLSALMSTPLRNAFTMDLHLPD